MKRKTNSTPDSVISILEINFNYPFQKFTLGVNTQEERTKLYALNIICLGAFFFFLLFQLIFLDCPLGNHSTKTSTSPVSTNGYRRQVQRHTWKYSRKVFRFRHKYLQQEYLSTWRTETSSRTLADRPNSNSTHWLLAENWWLNSDRQDTAPKQL